MKKTLILACGILLLSGCSQRGIYTHKFIETHKSYSYGDFYDGTNENLDNGISFTFIANNINDVNEPLIKGSHFQLMATKAYLYSNGQVATWDYTSIIQAKANDYMNLFGNQYQDKLITISINTDKSITYYLNGNLLFTWLGTIKNTSSSSEMFTYSISSLYYNIINDIHSSGFYIGNNHENDSHCTIKDFRINQGMNDQEARDFATNYNIINVKYRDEFGRSIASDNTYISLTETEYSLPSPLVECYTPSSSVINGKSQKSEDIVVNYTFNGLEHVDLKNNVLNKTNGYNWPNTDNWLKYLNDVEGDFSIKVEFNNKGCLSMPSTSSAKDIVWRTALPIVYNPVTNDRWVCRLDWWGWLDELNGDGIQLGSNPNFNNGNCYVSNFSRDMYYVLSDCDVSMIYMRRNNNLVMKCKIFPNHKLYQQFTYDYACSLDNLTSEKLNFAFSAEDAIVTINSLKY